MKCDFINNYYQRYNMNKKLILFLFVFLPNLIWGQIDINLILANWRVGKEKVIYGNTVLRHEGKNDYRGQLNVGYQTYTQVQQQIEQQAEKEMWTPEKRQETLETYEKYASGGMIHLYLTRPSITEANTNMFTVIVKDTVNGKEIFRKDLKPEIPNTPESATGRWSNYAVVPIPTEIESPFFIYIIDKFGGENNKFLFEVKI